MSIKQHPDKEPVLPPAPPSWGLLAAKGDLAAAVRFIIGNRTVSYPCHALSRWELSAGNADSLVIWTGKDQVTVTGRKLAALRDALDDGVLLQVKISAARYADVRTGPMVTAITIEPLKND